jgi:hypothetical protein
MYLNQNESSRILRRLEAIAKQCDNTKAEVEALANDIKATRTNAKIRQNNARFLRLA